MSKAPKLDDATLKLMGALVRMPPKPHDEMKIGKKAKPKPTATTKRQARKKS